MPAGGAAESMSSPATGPLDVEPMTLDDGPAVLDIFSQGIATGIATFETATPDWDRWQAGHRRDCRFVARLAGRVVGWTALSPYSGRAVYAGVAWESVYVDAGARGRGVGRALLATLIPASEAAGVWTLLAGVQAENAASLALHEAAGFRRIGVQERVGRDAAGVWRDVVLLERRSPTTGA
jgi:L-amino acid N-acyltransferase YncA